MSAGRPIAPAGRSPGLGGQYLLQDRCHPANGGVFKNADERHFDHPCIPHPGDDTRRKERMTTELEEVFIDPDAFQIEDFAPYPGECLFRRSVRRI